MTGVRINFFVPALASAALALAVIAPAGQAALPTCPPGTTNANYCQTSTVLNGPVLKAQALSAACRASAARMRVPATAITAAAGLKRVTVTLDGHVLKTVKMSAKKSYTLKSVSFSTRGLKVGLHTITVTAVDSAGKTARRVFHFTICKPKPKFTG
jgi:hypothetical protein